MLLHIHVSVGLETDTLFLQQLPVLRPPWSRTPCDIHHSVTRQFLCPRRISERPPNHPRMTGPTCQQCDMPIGRHPTTRYLTDDVQHILTKCPGLRGCHSIGIFLHYITFNISGSKIGIFPRNCSKKDKKVHSRCNISIFLIL